MMILEFEQLTERVKVIPVMMIEFEKRSNSVKVMMTEFGKLLEMV
jgi:hypothetical protein